MQKAMNSPWPQPIMDPEEGRWPYPPSNMVPNGFTRSHEPMYKILFECPLPIMLSFEDSVALTTLSRHDITFSIFSLQ